jgi:hypothetical protein
MKHVTSRSLFAYWNSLRGQRAAPERADIEPGEIRDLLADMFILEVSGSSVEFRLAGTRLCALFGRELTRSSFSSLWGDEGPDALTLVESVALDATGVVAGLRATSSSGEELPLELLLLPLRHRGRASVRILGALSASTFPLWAGIEPIVDLTTTSLRVLRPNERVRSLDKADQHRVALAKRRQWVVLDGGLAPLGSIGR